MSEFQELVKNFDRVRDYIRQFFIYGFKSRNEFDQKSGRTYDNERRRAESWLSAYTHSLYTPRGKQVYICADSKTIEQNPLYAAWKSKSFTDKDLLLHFFLPELLREESLTAGEISDQMAARWGLAFDSQTVRLKLKEYENNGILYSEKDGRALRYQLTPPLEWESSPLSGKLLTAVSFFQGTAPFGAVGSTIMDLENARNTLFQLKHQFIVHTLDDRILLHLVTAIREQRGIAFTLKREKTEHVRPACGIPLKMMVSTRTGRRFLCLYSTRSKRLTTVRLDMIQEIRLLEPYPDYPKAQAALARNLPACFGISFHGTKRMESITFLLEIDDAKEAYLLERLQREGRGGQITQEGKNRFRYTARFFDTNEIAPWIKTFTGRVLELSGTNDTVISRIKNDWQRMYLMYEEE